MVNQKTRDYHNSMPLQPPSQGLVCAILKSVHVLGQKEVVHQTFSNTTPLTFFPHPYAGRGLSFSWNVSCHSGTAREVDATYVPIRAIGSWMTIPLDGWGGVRVGSSPEPIGVCLAVCCLFQAQLGGGMGGGGV